MTDSMSQVEERFGLVEWHDATMHAAMWLRRTSVKPDDAAMLLWRLDPLERDWQGNAPDPERIYVDGDEATPEHYRALRHAFEDVAETDPKPRTLLDWRDVAKREGLRYHQWIDEYVQAQIEELPANSGSGDGAKKVDVGVTAARRPDIPGKLPRIAIGRLAVSAAWQIERESKRAPTTDKVIERLQEWATGGEHPHVLLRAEPRKRAVIWMTKKTGKEKEYDVGACGKTLDQWRKSRA